MNDRAMIAEHEALTVAATSVLPHGQIGANLTGKHPIYDLELITDIAAFEALEHEWNALFERAGLSAQVFQQFNWLWHVNQHYGCAKRDPKPVIVTARNHGRLIMVWPLQLSCANGLCHLSWLSEPVGQYGDVLIDRVPYENELLADAWTLVCNTIKPDVIVLRRVRSDSRIADFLKAKNLTRIESGAAPALDLRAAASFDGFCRTHQTRHQRKERRRLTRRLTEAGNVVFRQISDPDEAAATARKAIAMKREWLVAKSLASKTLSDDRVIEFFADVASGAEKHVGCEVHTAELDGRPIGAQLLFRCKNRLAMHIIVYDVAYSRTGIGLLQLADTIEKAFERDVEVIDLLAPKAGYKMEWANTTVAVEDYAASHTLKGKLFLDLYIKRMRPALKSIVPHLPRRVRQFAQI
jgi:CelD/BcsL family acetyltransferase involved in cellulose biosynthesis